MLSRLANASIDYLIVFSQRDHFAMPMIVKNILRVHRSWSLLAIAGWIALLWGDEPSLLFSRRHIGQNMLVIGLTGGVGSVIVADLFAELGVPIIGDAIAREVTLPGQPASNVSSNILDRIY